MPLKAIIFDFGGVLCFHPEEHQIRELAMLCGLSRDEFLEQYWALRHAYDRGDFSPQEYWSRIGDATGQSYSPDQIEEFRRRDVNFWVRLDQCMMRWAAQVRAAGIRTAVLSNLPADLGEHLRNDMELVKNFDHHSFSYELRSAKPDAAIYRHAYQGLAVAPEEAVFLDDKIENIEGARAVGLYAIHFQTPAQLIEDLRSIAGDFMPVGAPPIILE
jgi:putative hydrolase of the HAD superfamily